MVRNALFLLLAAAAGFAQNGANPFDRPPADVDKALRERITEFFQCHVTGQYRKAEEIVAECTRDYYYNGKKPKYFSFEIQRIDYSDNYTRAKATVLTELSIAAPGFAGQLMKFPLPSTWKLEKDGKWYWFVDQEALLNTPWGKRTPSNVTAGQAAAPPPASIPTTADFAMRKVKADKLSIALKQGESADVSFSNTASGYMTVSVYAPTPGIDVKPERADIKPGGSATFTIKAVEGAAPSTIVMQVDQTGEQIPIQVKIN